MKTSKFLCIISQALCFIVAEAYDIRCIWPDQFVRDPFEALHHGRYFGEFVGERKIETPIVVRLTQHATMCRAMCLSLHDPDVLDPYNKRPTWTVPEYGQNAFSTVMCIGQCMLYATEGFYDYNELAMEKFKTEFGLDYELPSTRPDIEAAWMAYMTDQSQESEQLMVNIMSTDAIPYNPYLMGHVAGYYVKYYQNQDGWNSQGEMNYDRETGEEVPCTGSCRPYQNTVGYKPVIDPRIHTQYSMDNTKYECTDNCRKWQPLQEGNDGGSLKRQEFIVPHVGDKAFRFLRQENPIVLADPNYDLHQDSLQVIREVNMTRSDRYRQDAVAFFDDKLKVRGLIRNQVRNKFSTATTHSFQDDLINLIGMATVEYDALLQAWKEKKYHDLVRPTTVIKHWGDDNVMPMGNGEFLKARDFEAYIRVMPHAEFPSGSSCLCTSYYEYTDMLTMAWYNDTIKNFSWMNYPVADLEEIRDLCGASRLWGGMHYPESIEGGNMACTGLAALAYDYTMALKNDATFTNPYYMDDGLGACPP